jgi:inosine-uridine nucleoside N-ribohydrolase
MSTSSESESSGSRCTNNELKRIIIDTDPGVDDAMAIMLALHAHIQGRLEIVAITLVKGNVPIKDAERNILRVLEVFELEDKVMRSLTSRERCDIKDHTL